MGSKDEGIRSKSRKSKLLLWCRRSIDMLKGEEERMRGEIDDRSSEDEVEVEVGRCSVAALGKLMRVDSLYCARWLLDRRWFVEDKLVRSGSCWAGREVRNRQRKKRDWVKFESRLNEEEGRVRSLVIC